MGEKKYTAGMVGESMRDLAAFYAAEENYEQLYLKLCLSNIKKIQQAEEQRIEEVANARFKRESEIADKVIEYGFKANLAKNQLMLKELERAYGALSDTTTEDAKKMAAEIERLKKEWADADPAEIESMLAVQNKLREREEKKFWKKSGQIAKDAWKEANLFDVVFGSDKLKETYETLTNEIRDQLLASGEGEEAANKKAGGIAQIKMIDGAIGALSDKIAGFFKQLEGTMKEIGSAKSEIDTRLQGSKNRNLAGSYWELMTTNVVRNVGLNPVIKQSAVVESLKNLVGKGIAFNVEQRAFLDTISDKIANTFEATDNTLLKLVRIQQQDTTAARLGMESALTAFLNNMYETTEYMTDAASAIRQSIYEASALMTAKEATAFEYQVQKWMGSLYSVGFGNAQGLADALGKLAAGDISGVTDDGYGNLLVMAANRANLSIARILAEGLDDSETNQLMRAMVEYLGEIYSETKNSKVVAQQFANVYGLTASDLKAAANLAKSTKTISNNSLTYGGAINRLTFMSSTALLRTNASELLTNAIDNLKYAMAESMGQNPILYLTMVASDVLRELTGGIKLPDISYMGTKVNLNTTVADLMAVAAGAGTALSALGKMASGLGSIGGLLGGLVGYGVDITGMGIKSVQRGGGLGLGLATLGSGVTTSLSGYVGNQDSSDVQNSTMQSATEEANQTAQAQQDESEETKLSTVDEHIVDIYKLLDSIVAGTDSLHIVVDNTDAFN